MPHRRRSRPAPLLPAVVDGPAAGRPDPRRPRRGAWASSSCSACWPTAACARSAAPAARPPARARARPTASASASATAPVDDASSPGPAAGAPLEIVGATGFDPQGDGSEGNSLAPKAYDDKPTSGWTSDTYKTRHWGGLKKGVGLRLDLGTRRPCTARRSGSAAPARRSSCSPYTGATLTGSTVLAKRSDASGSVTLTVAHPISTRYVVVWFTTPGQFSGGYRAEVDDVVLR